MKTKEKLSRRLIDSRACDCINRTAERFFLQLLRVVGAKNTSCRPGAKVLNFLINFFVL